MAVQQYAYPFESDIDATGISNGMEVRSHDGEELGVVSEVWTHIPPYGYVAKSSFARADYGPIRGTMHLLVGAGGYAQVTRRGISREGDGDLFVPFDAIRDIVPDEALIVGHSRQTSRDLFDRRPADLDGRF